MSCQQHGSVYWSTDSDSLLAGLDESKSLAEQLVPKAFSSLKAPIWQDSSTTIDCKRLEEEYGGAQAVADCSGSRAYERFTGNQISRARISSFSNLNCLLIGQTIDSTFVS